MDPLLSEWYKLHQDLVEILNLVKMQSTAPRGTYTADDGFRVLDKLALTMRRIERLARWNPQRLNSTYARRLVTRNGLGHQLEEIYDHGYLSGRINQEEPETSEILYSRAPRILGPVRSRDQFMTFF